MHLLLAVACCRLVGCAPGLTKHEYQRVIMGVQAKITVYSPTAEQAERAAAAAFTRMGELDAIMSDYRVDSELNALSNAAGGEARIVSPDLWRVLETGRRISEATEGAFDMTVGPAVAQWRAARKSGRLAPEEERRRALSLVNWEHLELDAPKRAARLSVPGMRLDLGGIAKGYAAREGLDRLRAAGLGRSSVALAGDIALGDAPPGTRGWKVAVRAGPRLPPSGMLTLTNVNVSTSGDTQQFVEIDGVRYSHIVDPRTGLGISPNVAVTTIAQDGAMCDAIATAACMLDETSLRKALDRIKGVGAVVQRLGGASIETHVLEPREGPKVRFTPEPSP